MFIVRNLIRILFITKASFQNMEGRFYYKSIGLFSFRRILLPFKNLYRNRINSNTPDHHDQDLMFHIP